MLCEVCGQSGRSRCSSCLAVGYCSKACQKAHWATHKFACRPDAVTLGDQLVHTVRRNEWPTDLTARSTFGFMRVGGPAEQRELVAFYCHLVDDRGVTAKMLDRWARGDLLSSISEAASAPPWTAERRRWYAWAQRMQHAWKAENAPLGTMTSDLVSTQLFICSRDPTYMDFVLAHVETPSALLMSRCTCLFAAVLNWNLPNQGDAMWLIFGFAAYYREEEEILRDAYRALIHHCAYTDFFRAVERGELLSLLERHGGLVPPHSAGLCDILSSSPYAFKAVWYLRQFIVVSSNPGADRNGPFTFEPHIASLHAFGLTDDLEPEEREALQKVYRKVLLHPAAEPLELQAAMERKALTAYVLRLPYVGRLSKVECKALKRLREQSGSSST